MFSGTQQPTLAGALIQCWRYCSINGQSYTAPRNGIIQAGRCVAVAVSHHVIEKFIRGLITSRHLYKLHSEKQGKSVNMSWSIYILGWTIFARNAARRKHSTIVSKVGNLGNVPEIRELQKVRSSEMIDFNDSLLHCKCLVCEEVGL